MLFSPSRDGGSLPSALADGYDHRQSQSPGRDDSERHRVLLSSLRDSGIYRKNVTGDCRHRHRAIVPAGTESHLLDHFQYVKNATQKHLTALPLNITLSPLGELVKMENRLRGRRDNRMTLSASFMIARSDDIASCSTDGKRINFWNSSVLNE